MKYELISKETPEALNEAVNAALANGAELHGVTMMGQHIYIDDPNPNIPAMPVAGMIYHIAMTMVRMVYCQAIIWPTYISETRRRAAAS